MCNFEGFEGFFSFSRLMRLETWTEIWTSGRLSTLPPAGRAAAGGKVLYRPLELLCRPLQLLQFLLMNEIGITLVYNTTNFA
jgi:hypothetical protein